MVGLLAALSLTWLVAEPVTAQGWSVEVADAWTSRNHPKSSPTARIPLVPEWGSVGLRYAGQETPITFGGRITFGAEEGRSSICGGFIQPGDCIPEQVRFSGGSIQVALGWEFRSAIGERIRVLARPSAGITPIWSRQTGLETGKEGTELKLGLSAGVAAELGVRPWAGRDGVVAVFYRPERTRAFFATCDDCANYFHGSVVRQAVGLVFRW